MLCHIGYCIWLAMLSYCKSTHFLSYKHQHHQKIIQYSDNLTIIHTIPRYFWCKTKERCKITSNPPNRPIWFVVAQLCLADAAFCIQNAIKLAIS